MTADSHWCSVRLLDALGKPVATLQLSGAGRPDLAAVDWVARVHLEAVQRGQYAEIIRICPDLVELIDLAGLSDEMPRAPTAQELGWSPRLPATRTLGTPTSQPD